MNSTMVVTIQKHVNLRTADASALASDYRYRGLDKFRAWDQFVIDRGLHPEMCAKDFYKLFVGVPARSITVREQMEITPNYYDTLLRMACQITVNDHGVFEIVWQDGSTGSNPPDSPPEATRFTPVEVVNGALKKMR